MSLKRELVEKWLTKLLRHLISSTSWPVLDYKTKSAIILSGVKISQSERRYWQETKAAGKGRFVRRGVLGSLVTGLVILLGLALRFAYLRTLQTTDLLAFLIVLPIFLLGGYLTTVWQWQDFEKKYPEDTAILRASVRRTMVGLMPLASERW